MATISYFTPGLVPDEHQQRRATWFFRAAIVLALLPMLLGVTIITLYWTTYWEPLVTAGLILLPVGFGMVLIGVSFLIVWRVIDRRVAKALNRPSNTRTFRLTLLLLLANLLVALVCVVAGWRLTTQTMIEIVNDSGSPIDQCTIQLPNGTTWSQPIPAGGRIHKTTREVFEGATTMRLQQGPAQSEVTLVGYSTTPFGPHVRATIKPGLVTDIHHLN